MISNEEFLEKKLRKEALRYHLCLSYGGIICVYLMGGGTCMYIYMSYLLCRCPCERHSHLESPRAHYAD
jgi:hypothetical protein